MFALFQVLLHTVPELNIGDGPEQTKVRTKLLNSLHFDTGLSVSEALTGFAFSGACSLEFVLAHVDFSID